MTLRPSLVTYNIRKTETRTRRETKYRQRELFDKFQRTSWTASTSVQSKMPPTINTTHILSRNLFLSFDQWNTLIRVFPSSLCWIHQIINRLLSRSPKCTNTVTKAKIQSTICSPILKTAISWISSSRRLWKKKLNQILCCLLTFHQFNRAMEIFMWLEAWLVKNLYPKMCLKSTSSFRWKLLTKWMFRGTQCPLVCSRITLYWQLEVLFQAHLQARSSSPTQLKYTILPGTSGSCCPIWRKLEQILLSVKYSIDMCLFSMAVNLQVFPRVSEAFCLQTRMP